MEFIKMLGNNKVKTEASKYHTIESHNYWVQRNKVCPYCKIGSTPTPKCFQNEDGTWDEKKIHSKR